MLKNLHMGKGSTAHAQLPRRERQLLEALYSIGEATAQQVREVLADPPSYSAVRATLAILEEKGLVVRSRGGRAHVYRPAKAARHVRRRALDELVRTFFKGRPADAAAMLLDGAEELSPEDLKRLEALVQRARKGGR